MTFRPNEATEVIGKTSRSRPGILDDAYAGSSEENSSARPGTAAPFSPMRILRYSGGNLWVST
jgi:hypothetical protein